MIDFSELASFISACRPQLIGYLFHNFWKIDL